MANTNPNVTSLLGYVEQNAMGLIGKSVLGAETTSVIDFQSGIKGDSYINILDTEVVLQDNSTCGFNPTSTQSISRRMISTKPINVQATYCDKNFLRTFAQHQVKMSAGIKTLPFEEEFVNGILEGIKEKIENTIWQGGEDSIFKGILAQLTEEGEVVKSVAKQTTILATLQKMLETLPTNALKEDTKFFMGKDTFLKLVNEMVNANLYHYSGENSSYRMVLAGTTIEIIGLNGLNGSNKVILSRANNFVYGTDFEGDEEKFEMWFSQDTRMINLNVEFNAGVAIKFPDEVVVTTLA